MGKGDIRTRRGKVWRGTYGVTRPRRYKTVVRPVATTRKAKTLKDLPKAVSESIVKKPVAEEAQHEVAGDTEKKPAAKKATVAKKPAVKKIPVKKD